MFAVIFVFCEVSSEYIAVRAHLCRSFAS